MNETTAPVNKLDLEDVFTLPWRECIIRLFELDAQEIRNLVLACIDEDYKKFFYVEVLQRREPCIHIGADLPNSVYRVGDRSHILQIKANKDGKFDFVLSFGSNRTPTLKKSLPQVLNALLPKILEMIATRVAPSIAMDAEFVLTCLAIHPKKKNRKQAESVACSLIDFIDARK